MKISHLLTAIALSSMIAPAAMAKNAVRIKSAHVKVHVAKKGKHQRAKRKGAKISRRHSKRAPELGRAPMKTRHQTSKRIPQTAADV